MQLVVFELGLTGAFGNTKLSQTITPQYDLYLESVRPHLYIANSPAGSLGMRVEDDRGRLVMASPTVTIASMKAAFSNQTYVHAYFKFDFGIGLKEGISYNLSLVSSGGYTYSNTVFVGWVNGHDLGKHTEDYFNKTGVNAALDCELWVKKTIGKENAI
jgi:hypothetical protein